MRYFHASFTADSFDVCYTVSFVFYPPNTHYCALNSTTALSIAPHDFHNVKHIAIIRNWRVSAYSQISILLLLECVYCTQLLFRQRQSYAHTTHSLCNASNVHKFPQSLFSSLHYNNFGAGRHSHSSHPLDQALLLFTSLFPSLLASSTAGCLPLLAAAPSAIFVLRLQLLAASKTALCPYVGHGLQQPWKPPGGGSRL